MSRQKLQLLPREWRAAVSLAGIFAFRMLGLFLILPVFALYARELDGVTPLLVGLAIGAYGLTQALLQIPFGRLSDRLGRKPVIAAGLLIFALGSVVAASADTIWGIIIGRALQGSGAIAAAVMALAADLSRDQARTRVMAVIGMSIGAAFAASLVLGPVLDGWIGVPGIFWFTALLALLGVVLLYLAVPDPKISVFHRDAEPVPGQFREVLRNPELLRLDFGIMVLHMMLTALFLGFPLALERTGLASADHWLVYLPVMLVSMAAMVPFIVVAEKRRRMKGVFLTAVAVLAVASATLAIGTGHRWELIFGLLLFFTAFNVLEASLPSLISKTAPSESKGTALGVYSTSQFAGAFVGGLIGGAVQLHWGLGGLFAFCTGAALIWLTVAFGMARPRHLTMIEYDLAPLSPEQAGTLQLEVGRLDGVREVIVAAAEGRLYLRVDDELFDPRALDAFEVVRA